MPTINELQDEIIEDFSALDDWMDRYALIIDLGNTLEPLPESDKTPTNIIDNQTPQDILESDLYFIKEIGLSEHLSPTRSNGLVSMLRQMRLFAAAFSSQS